jgi:hypothetical protein
MRRPAPACRRWASARDSGAALLRGCQQGGRRCTAGRTGHGGRGRPHVERGARAPRRLRGGNVEGVGLAHEPRVRINGLSVGNDFQARPTGRGEWGGERWRGKPRRSSTLGLRRGGSAAKGPGGRERRRSIERQRCRQRAVRGRPGEPEEQHKRQPDADSSHPCLQPQAPATRELAPRLMPNAHAALAH